MSSPTEGIAIYLRVSTKKQDTNTSKETQLAAAYSYCEQNGLDSSTILIYEDKESASRSVKSTNIEDDRISSRPGLNTLLFDAKLGKFDTVIVYNHDRLTRNVHESFILKFLFQKLKIEVAYCKPGEKLNSQNEKFNNFYENLLNNLSQLESSLISSRTRLGNEYNVTKGFWPGGHPPYGYKLKQIPNDKKKSKLEIVYTQARVVQEVFSLYLQGNSPKIISKHIKLKHPNIQDRKWSINTVKGVLNNEEYLGYIVWNKKGGARNPVRRNENEHIRSSEAVAQNIVINQGIWDNVKRLKDVLRANPKYLSTPFLLKGFLFCDGIELKCKNNGGNKGRVYYSVEKKGKWSCCFKAEAVENKVIEYIGRKLSSILLSDDNFNNFYDEYISRIDLKNYSLKKERLQLEFELKDNEILLQNCDDEIATIDTTSRTKKQDTSSFLESLRELHSYLSINKSLLKSRLQAIDEEFKKTIYEKNTLKDLLSNQKNLFVSIRKNTSDDEIYRRSLRVLLFNIVKKVEISKSGDIIEIVIK